MKFLSSRNFQEAGGAGESSARGRLVCDKPGDEVGGNHAELRGYGEKSEFSSKSKKTH